MASSHGILLLPKLWKCSNDALYFDEIGNALGALSKQYKAAISKYSLDPMHKSV
jgi:hypothetical protein